MSSFVQGSVLVELVVVLLVLSAALSGYQVWVDRIQGNYPSESAATQQKACFDIELATALQANLRHGQQAYLDVVLPLPPRNQGQPVACYE